eukprot:TRINITY_DN67629_c0_g1_i1.p1 TRINITY_DN67629_c0_g1~~TRINITY_DN67629_c0_g1_i1.p1  ORF type:complete len:256 (-),score=20.50 TRINITY_DN67629_c0_g1_i1:764-1531(-)
MSTSKPRSVNATAIVMASFAICLAVLLFALAYLVASRPTDYGGNLHVQIHQMGAAIRRCVSRLNHTSDSTALYEKYVSCSKSLTVMDASLERCNKDLETQQKAVHDEFHFKDSDAGLEILRSIRKPGGTGAVSEIVDTVDHLKAIPKTYLIELLIRDIAEKRAMRLSVLRACEKEAAGHAMTGSEVMHHEKNAPSGLKSEVNRGDQETGHERAALGHRHQEHIENDVHAEGMHGRDDATKPHRGHSVRLSSAARA